MNITINNQQLIRSTSANTAGTVKTAQPKKKTDSVQISKTGAELSKASSASTATSTMEASTDTRAEDKRVSAGSIESVMARYKEAQNFMAQIEFQSVNSTA